MFEDANGVVAILPDPPPPAPPPVYLWYLDPGDFLDRFGPALIPLLTSADPVIQAFVKNVPVRKWIDLQRPDVIAAVNYAAGSTTTGLGTISAPIANMTAALANTILTTLPLAAEQFTTVKLYFS